MSRTDRILSRLDGSPEPIETLPSHRDTVAVWDYDLDAGGQNFKLYRQGRVADWTVDDLEFDSNPVPERWLDVERDVERAKQLPAYKNFSADTWLEWDNEMVRYMLSQTLHGEQMGVLCGAALAQVAPSWDVKLFATTQAADEARHLEAFSKYLDRIGGPYPVNGHLHALFHDALTSPDWDMIYIAAQVMVEGMGLGVFGWLGEEANDPALRKMLRLTLADEARHVAFGVGALADVISNLSAAELRHRIEFLDEVAHALADRLVAVPVAERFGVDARDFVKGTVLSPSFRHLQSRVLRHIGPVCAKLDLLDAYDGRLRRTFSELGLLETPGPSAARRTKS